MYARRLPLSDRSFFLSGPRGTGKTTWLRHVLPDALWFEVKASMTWRREFGGPLKALVADKVVRKGFGVYTGTAELKDGPLRVLPLTTFFRELAQGTVLR